jgi:hypothetical protein
VGGTRRMPLTARPEFGPGPPLDHTPSRICATQTGTVTALRTGGVAQTAFAVRH